MAKPKKKKGKDKDEDGDKSEVKDKKNVKTGHDKTRQGKTTQ